MLMINFIIKKWIEFCNILIFKNVVLLIHYLCMCAGVIIITGDESVVLCRRDGS